MSTDRVDGSCEVCGKKSKVKTCYGMQACATCSVTMVRIKNDPELVVRSLEKFHGNKYTGGADEFVDMVRDAMNLTSTVSRADIVDAIKQMAGSYHRITGRISDLIHVLGVQVDEDVVQRAREVMASWRSCKEQVAQLEYKLEHTKKTAQTAPQLMVDVNELLHNRELMDALVTVSEFIG